MNTFLDDPDYLAHMQKNIAADDERNVAICLKAMDVWDRYRCIARIRSRRVIGKIVSLGKKATSEDINQIVSAYQHEQCELMECAHAAMFETIDKHRFDGFLS